MATVVTSAKSQIVIPKKERERVGLKPGMRVSVTVVEDHIEIRPLKENPVGRFHGYFKRGPSLTGALLEERRKERRYHRCGPAEGGPRPFFCRLLRRGHGCPRTRSPRHGRPRVREARPRLDRRMARLIRGPYLRSQEQALTIGERAARLSARSAGRLATNSATGGEYR